jgi:glycine cleavage system H protein
VTNRSSFLSLQHEYCHIDGNIATIGVTDFAQAALGDVVYVDLPSVGDTFEAGESFGSVESVKAASDVYAPVGGTVTAVNEVLDDEPGTINTAAETEGWFIKIEMSDAAEAEKLMDEAAYKAHCEASA